MKDVVFIGMLGLCMLEHFNTPASARNVPHMLRNATEANKEKYNSKSNVQKIIVEHQTKDESSEDEGDWTNKVPKDKENREIYEVMCYFPNWGQYRAGLGRYTVDQIDPFICSHIHYAFADIQGYTVAPFEVNDFVMYAELNALRDINPSLRTLLSVGGASVPSSAWRQITESQQAREIFVANTLQYVLFHGFNGVDLDWEYPGGYPDDGKNFVLLLEEFRIHINMESARTNEDSLILSVALGISDSLIYGVYDIPAISRYVNFANIMTYNMHGYWSGVTGFHSPLHGASSWDYDSQELVVLKFLEGGMEARKLILGVPTYGQSFTLCNPGNHYVGAPSCGPGLPGPYTRQPGTLAYFEICYGVSNGYSRVYDETQKVPYAYGGNQWTGYDDVTSILEKTQFLMENLLGGIMFWDMSMDDFSNRCGDGAYPLIRAGQPPSDVSSSTTNTHPTPPISPPPSGSTTQPSTTTQPTPPAPTSSRPPTSTPPGQCGQPPECGHDGQLFPHPCDCTAFYQCANGVAHLFFCQPTLYFDPTISVCNYPDAVDCQIGGNHKGPHSKIPVAARGEEDLVN